MASPPTRLLVLRHGQSEWNAQGRWQGQADPPLTHAGMRQAAAATEQLGVFDGIWASTLQRAALTAHIIAELLGFGPVQLDLRLQEAHYGAWQGLTMREVEAGWPGHLAQHRRPDDAEPIDEVIDRVSSCMHHIAASAPGGEILVVTHAGVIRSMRRSLGATDHRFGNLDGCWFHVHSDRGISLGDDVALGTATTTSDTL